MRKGISVRTLAGWGLTTVFFAVLGFASYANPVAKKAAAKQGAPKAAPAEATAGFSPADAQALAARFEKEIWPLMSRADGGCLSCHVTQNASQFLLLGDSKAAFQKMLAEGHFDPDNHSSIIGRITTTDKTLKMPPAGMTQWTAAEVALLTAFAEDVQEKRQVGAAKPDEVFPIHLLSRYTGEPSVNAADNTFLSYRQLRGKIQAIFGDDWRRDDRDLFIENLHLFGGADFVRRFDETTKASPTFLTGVEMLGRDVASRAYLTRSGPFAGLPAALPSPARMKAPDAAYARAINQVYNRMLFRDATALEMRDAFRFIQAVYKTQGSVAATAPQDLRFALTVRDPQGLRTTQDVTIRVTGDRHTLYQEFVDQSKAVAGKAGAASIVSRALKGTFTFKPGDTGQKVEISNYGTHGNVSVHGITLRGPLPAQTEKTVLVNDPSVRPEGAWRIQTEGDVTSYEDNNENKGKSVVTFPVSVGKPGTYQVSVSWRKFKADAGRKTSAAAAPPFPPTTCASRWFRATRRAAWPFRRRRPCPPRARRVLYRPVHRQHRLLGFEDRLPVRRGRRRRDPQPGHA